jgi:hypothetical protein
MTIQAMAKALYLELDKVALVAWVDKALQQSLKKENIKLGFRVFGIWPLNFTTMVRKINLNDEFITTIEEEHELSYHSNAANDFSNNAIEVAIMLLNIAGTFQAKIPTTLDCPLSPMPRYYVEMPNSLGTTTM